MSTLTGKLLFAYRSIAALEQERDALAAENLRLLGQIEGLKDTLAGASMWIEGVADDVLYPLSIEVDGGLGAIADGLGSCAPDLLRGIDEALSSGKEVD
jgi:hypothetical protein